MWLEQIIINKKFQISVLDHKVPPPYLETKIWNDIYYYC